MREVPLYFILRMGVTVTNQNKTAILALLDRSGSMASIRSDAEGGLRTFIDDQRKEKGECSLRVCVFDTEYDEVYPSTDIQTAAYPEIHPRGATALLDAWGRALTEFGEELSALPESERPGTVIFVVVTDGLENSSREWTRDKVFEAVRRQTEQYGWTFLFLAANQDAVATGESLGVRANCSVTYSQSSAGVGASYDALSQAVTRTRGGTFRGFTEEQRAAADA